MPGSGVETRWRLAHDICKLGLRRGDTVLVHASLSSIGWVDGGADTVVRAVREIIGPEGTLVVPTMTADNSDPSRWGITRGEIVPDERWPALRDSVSAFDPASTPSYGMGAIAETVRTWKGAVRSAHPQTSFAAVGHDAEALMAGHDRRCHLGRASPLAKLLKRRARVLLVGVPWDVCTVFHYAEYEVAFPRYQEYACVVMTAGGREWFRYFDVVLDASRFGELGAAFEAGDDGRIRRGRVGEAECRLFGARAAVAFAVGWLGEHGLGPEPTADAGAGANWLA